MRTLFLGAALAACACVAAVGATPSPTADSWEYTALGDSLATGYLASQGYVSRYATMLEADAGATVTLYNLGKNGQTSGGLLASFQDTRKGASVVRTAVAASDVVTWNIGLNDFRNARSKYKSGKCGGGDNQDCMRTALTTFRSNWNAILTTIVSLRSTDDTVLRTMDMYNPWVGIDASANTVPDNKEQQGPRGSDLQVIAHYLAEANAHIVDTATASLVPVALVALAFNGESGLEDPAPKGYLASDLLHPSDAGHEAIALELRKLVYAPLR
jgi:lysophospholipase L1-like esterase